MTTSEAQEEAAKLIAQAKALTHNAHALYGQIAATYGEDGDTEGAVMATKVETSLVVACDILLAALQGLKHDDAIASPKATQNKASA